MHYINLDQSATELTQILRQKGWLIAPKESVISIEKPGEGNMNVVLRVKTNERSFILKQSRPYVQKYQQIEAPLDRIDVEHQFYQAIKSDQLNAYVPAILAYDPTEYLMMMEDLGHCEDMTGAYNSKKFASDTIQQLTEILASIHQSDLPNNYPENKVLRQLNHQHIFVLPFLEDNGFQLDDLQEGLQDLSLTYKTDLVLKAVVEKIGAQYLSPGATLLHGDYYPGSWMTTADKLYVIDPEFSFAGFAEFDVGVMAGHLILISQDIQVLDFILKNYKHPVNEKLVAQVAGIEIIRRLIGLAQLPLSRSLEEKAQLLQLAKTMILS